MKHIDASQIPSLTHQSQIIFEIWSNWMDGNGSNDCVRFGCELPSQAMANDFVQQIYESVAAPQQHLGVACRIGQG